MDLKEGRTDKGLLTWDKRSSQQIEQICPGVTRMWLHKGQIVCYSVTTVARPAVDAWMQATHDLIHAWPREQIYLSVHDISEATLTPYIRNRTSITNKLMPKDLKGRSAVIVPRTFINQMIRLFVANELGRQNKSIQRDVFFRFEEAIEWLVRGIEPRK